MVELEFMEQEEREWEIRDRYMRDPSEVDEEELEMLKKSIAHGIKKVYEPSQSPKKGA